MPFIGDEGGPLHHLNLSGFANYLSPDSLERGFDTRDPHRLARPSSSNENAGGPEVRQLVRQVASVRAAIERYLDRNPHLASEVNPSDIAIGEVAQQVDRFRATVGRVSGQNHTVGSETARLMEVTLKLLGGPSGRG